HTRGVFNQAPLAARVVAIATMVVVASVGMRADAVELTVAPQKIELRHARQPQSVVVGERTSSGFTVDLGGEAKFAIAQPDIASVSADGWVTPLKSGATTLQVTARGATVSIPVSVELPAETPPTSFRHEVMPVFSKNGCNFGACHGYSLGKNGFKLSLRGQEPDADYAAVVRDSIGRRVDLTQPAESLLITKPLGVAPHQGGVRLRRGTLSHEILTNWVAQGAPHDSADVREVVAVSVHPAKLVLAPGAKHRLQLIATYSDGSRRDVTRLGCFAVNNELHAGVTDDGVVTGGDFGETAVVARFERKFAAVDVIVLKESPAFVATPVPDDHIIDKLVVRKLNDLRIAPSPLTSDERFLRRVSLDLIGLQPTPAEVRAFVADTDPQKRVKAIDRLFERPEFVDHWSLKWGDLLQNSRNVLSPSSVYLFREWIRGAVASNMPLDEFARRLLTARGGAEDDPAAAYLSISKDVNDTVERTTQVFCGVRMLCARCHSHPLENWTQGDYYGVASFFTQATTKVDPRQPGVQNAKLLFVNAAAGPATNPRTSRPQPPRFLGGQEPALASDVDRREAYARWLTAPENPYFARGLANRIWSY
ncbi:MAG TPA: DUF1549 domain-containing protein, partial [Pirellulaceae bacterium]|nr:DUF1549 domain-containing protein [Pirellulaceae bacterium]